MKTHILIQKKNDLMGFCKRNKMLSLILLSSLSAMSLNAQDSPLDTANIVPQNKGDNFSLEGALALFKKAKTVEQFERMINDQNSNVNNLDLNNDGKTDYIYVNDIKENNAHILVLSTNISENKTQDIATINVEKSGDNQANVQIIGDPDLYPSNTISEPVDYNGQIKADNGNSVNQNDSNRQSINNSNYSSSDNTNNQAAVNVWGWPLVQFMYNPYYSVWNSPYYWGYLPVWYRPWHPFLYSSFYFGCNIYRPHYRIAPVVRVNYSRNVYLSRRDDGAYRQNFNRVENRSLSQRNLENRNSNFESRRMGGYTNHMSSGFRHVGGGRGR